MGLYRPDLKGGATFWQDGCALQETPSALTTFTVDDAPLSNDYIYPLLPHASSPKVDVVQWKTARSAVISGQSRLAFGICLEAPDDNDDVGTIYEYSINGKATIFTGEGDVNLIAGFGQLRGNNATPVRNIGQMSGSTRRNESCWTALNGQQLGGRELLASGTVLVKRGISTVDPESSTVGNPVVIACVIVNRSSSTRSFNFLHIHISGMKYAAPIDVFEPHPYSV